MKESILITGATGKIGNILVSHFLELGYEVIAVGRSNEKLNKLLEINQPISKRLNNINQDLSVSDCGSQLLTKLNSLGLSPSVLINNARSLDNLQTDENGCIDDSTFINEFKLSVISPYNLVMSLIQSTTINLKSVINVSSIYGIVAPNLSLYTSPETESFIHYGVAKAALIHLTKELAVRLSKKSVRVNCIAYGGVEGRVDEAFKKRYGELCPSGKMLNEKDLTGAMELLVSDQSKGINGHTLIVDGGWSIW